MNLIDKNNNSNFRTKDKLNAYNKERCKQLQAKLWKKNQCAGLKNFPCCRWCGSGLCGPSIQVIFISQHKFFSYISVTTYIANLPASSVIIFIKLTEIEAFITFNILALNISYTKAHIAVKRKKTMNIQCLWTIITTGYKTI